MDRLDRISAWAVGLLCVWALVLVVYHGKSDIAAPGLAGKKTEVRRYLDPDFEKKIDLAKKLIVGGSMEKAELLVDELVNGYAFEAQP